MLGALGVYRAAFTTIEQTEPLIRDKVRVPIVALGGEKAQGARVREMVERVATHVDGGAISDCGHFIPEERPEELVRRVLAMTARAPRTVVIPDTPRRSHTMKDSSNTSSDSTPIPADDPRRQLTRARPDTEGGLRHISEAEKAEREARAEALAPRFRTEFLKPQT